VSVAVDIDYSVSAEAMTDSTRPLFTLIGRMAWQIDQLEREVLSLETENRRLNNRLLEVEDGGRQD
jgi:hypothetical protein